MDNNTTTSRVFVYGTLQSGRSNNRVFNYGKSRLLGKAVTVDPYLLMDFGGFPGMYKLDKDVKRDLKINQQQLEVINIHGELWEIDDAALAACDRLEGHPSGYRRTPIKVNRYTDGTNPPTGVALFDCETYFYQGGIHGIPCTNGVWPRTIRITKA